MKDIYDYLNEYGMDLLDKKIAISIIMNRFNVDENITINEYNKWRSKYMNKNTFKSYENNKINKEEKIKKILKYKQENKTVNEIAKLTNISVSSIYKLIRENEEI